jgi:hypothetical protein
MMPKDVREGALVHHEFSGGGRKPAHTWNDDGAAHDGQRDAVDHSIEPRHGQHGVQKRGDGKRARHQSEQGKRGASQNERELVAPQLQFQRRFKDDEDEAHRAEQFQNESFKRNVVEAYSSQPLAQPNAHGDEHQHTWDVCAPGQKVGEVRKDDDGTSADDNAVGVDVVCRKFEAEQGKGSHAPKINQIRR